MSTRVVLLSEGSGESAGSLSVRPSPGDALDESQFGPAHLLLRRTLSRAWSREPQSFVFLEPLRLKNGRVARGSQLLDRRHLVQLHDWPRRELAPEVSIVFVDCDEVRDRREQLAKALEKIVHPRWVIAVAVQEFEAWLVADQQAMKHLGQPVPDQSPVPEMMRRREAKQLLETWLVNVADTNEGRRDLARKINLDVVKDRCPSYARFFSDLVDFPADCKATS